MKKQYIFKKYVFSILLLSTLCLAHFTPIVGFANDSYFDCLEDESKCDEEMKDNTPVQSPEKDNEKPDIEKEERKESVGLTPGDYIKTLFALVFVVGLLYALLKFLNKKNRLDDKSRLMKNLGGISLGQQKSIQLVVVGGTYYLVGVGEDIRLLKEITDEHEINALLEQYEEVDETPFKGLFEQLLAKVSPFKNKGKSVYHDEGQDFGDMLNHRLDEIKAERKSQIHRLTDKERNKDG